MSFDEVLVAILAVVVIAMSVFVIATEVQESILAEKCEMLGYDSAIVAYKLKSCIVYVPFEEAVERANIEFRVE